MDTRALRPQEHARVKRIADKRREEEPIQRHEPWIEVFELRSNGAGHGRRPRHDLELGGLEHDGEELRRDEFVREEFSVDAKVSIVLRVGRAEAHQKDRQRKRQARALTKHRDTTARSSALATAFDRRKSDGKLQYDQGDE